jgi:hypothetical protein
MCDPRICLSAVMPVLNIVCDRCEAALLRDPRICLSAVVPDMNTVCDRCEAALLRDPRICLSAVVPDLNIVCDRCEAALLRDPRICLSAVVPDLNVVCDRRETAFLRLEDRDAGGLQAAPLHADAAVADPTLQQGLGVRASFEEFLGLYTTVFGTVVYRQTSA